MPETDDSPDTTRRTVLRAAAATSGVLTTGVATGSASPGEAGTVELVEATLLYDVPSPSAKNTHYETTPLCDHPDYVADPETRTIRPAQRPGGATADSLLRDNRGIVNFGGASPLPRSDLGGSRAAFAVAELGTGVSPAAAYVLNEPVPVPQVSARLSGGEAVVRGAGQGVTVERRSRGVATLPAQTLRLQERSVLDDTVDAPDLPEHLRARQTRTRTRELSVQPELHVHHRGRFTVEGV